MAREWNKEIEELLHLWGIQLLIQIQRHKQAQWRSQVAHWLIFITGILCNGVATLTIWTQFNESDSIHAVIIVTGVLQALGLFMQTLANMLGLNVATQAHFFTWIASEDLVRQISMTLGLERDQRQDMETFVSNIWNKYHLINTKRPLTLMSSSVELSHNKLVKRIIKNSSPNLAAIAVDATCDSSDSDSDDTLIVNQMADELVRRNSDVFGIKRDSKPNLSV